MTIRIWFRIRSFDEKKLKKIRAEKFNIFDQKLQLTYPQATIKDVPATREAFSSQNKNIQQSQHFKI